MQVRLDYVQGRGTAQQECVHLTVMEDCDLHDYQLLDATYSGDGKISLRHRHSYQLPQFRAKAGDVVVVYTGKGPQTSKRISATNQIHFFYWGLGRTIWNDSGDTALLQMIAAWQTATVNRPPLRSPMSLTPKAGALGLAFSR